MDFITRYFIYIPPISVCLLSLDPLVPQPDQGSESPWAPTFSFVHESMEREIFGRMKGRKDAAATGVDRLREQGGQSAISDQISMEGFCLREQPCQHLNKGNIVMNSGTWQHWMGGDSGLMPLAMRMKNAFIPSLPLLRMERLLSQDISTSQQMENWYSCQNPPVEPNQLGFPSSKLHFYRSQM